MHIGQIEVALLMSQRNKKTQIFKYLLVTLHIINRIPTNGLEINQSIILDMGN